ncbi:MFS transporter [Pseudobutyrivibrio sp.]|uniref:MFS transporter n=1 Tax=Pseudobutyrivibrio sp. TaxID=2014367 RepID=UPI001DE71831|nr:glycoside-pentoside-hexuronide (GPH):cation symporter [Pseudobutyrivibrio sp.]MBE5909860.1 MFS transporter [Pseudobutyrivibrio sp.]
MNTKKGEVGNLQVGMYGIGNFAAQLSWTMVSTYLAIFYTDVFGLAPAAVALLMLIAKVWDGINDPIMGVIMEKNNSRFGKYRPFIVVGTIVLVVFTILTFTVPNFGSTGKLVWAYVTYICLGMSYTMENVPFNALPSRMTKNPNRINQLFSASMMGGAFGGMVLMSCTLPIVMALGNGDQAVGYQRTAALYAIVAVILNLIVVYFCKENVETVEKAKQTVTTKELVVAVLKNRNLMLLLIYTLILMISVMGRVGVMIYFYMYCVANPALMGVLMIIPNIAGMLVMPFCPVLMRKFGKKNVAIAGVLIGSFGLGMMFFGPYTNMPWMILASIVYGCYSIGSPCGGGLLIDAVDEYEKKNGVRTEGLAFSLSGLMNKIGGGIGSAAGVALIGFFGYTNNAELTPTILKGINVGANLMPIVMMLLALVPLFFFNAKESNGPVENKETVAQDQKATA